MILCLVLVVVVIWKQLQNREGPVLVVGVLVLAVYPEAERNQSC